MDFNLIKSFISNYGIITIAIAIFVSLLAIIVDKVFKEKIPTTIRKYLPVFSALILEFVYDMVFVSKCFTVSENALYTGVLAGSLSTVFTVVFNKIKRGENVTLDLIVLLVEGILDGIVDDGKKSATAIAIANELNSNDSNANKHKVIYDEIVKNQNVNEKLSKTDLLNIIENIFIQAKSVKTSK